MDELRLIGYTVRRLEIINNIRKNGQLRFENKCGYQVMYGKDACRGELKCEVFDSESRDNFSVTLVLEGVFKYDLSESKEKLHVDSFKELFPYARAIISAATAAGGMPPVMMPFVDISKGNIFRIDKNPETGV